MNVNRNDLWKMIALPVLLGITLSQAVPSGPGFFGEIYHESIYSRHEQKNTINMAQAFIGLRTKAGGIGVLDLYGKVRYSNDDNRDFWNNRMEGMAGARLRFFEKIYLAIYAEYVTGKAVIEAPDLENPYGRDYHDFRYGFIFWHGWEETNTARINRWLPLSGWSEVYSDITYLQKDHKNYILYLNGKLGFTFINIHKSKIDLYGSTYFGIDTNKDFWNNKFEYGLGLRICPWMDVDLKLFVEYLRGSYLDRTGRYENPYDRVYEDWRLGLLFWHGWGR